MARICCGVEFAGASSWLGSEALLSKDSPGHGQGIILEHCSEGAHMSRHRPFSGDAWHQDSQPYLRSPAGDEQCTAQG